MSTQTGVRFMCSELRKGNIKFEFLKETGLMKRISYLSMYFCRANALVGGADAP